MYNDKMIPSSLGKHKVKLDRTLTGDLDRHSKRRYGCRDATLLVVGREREQIYGM